MKQKAKQVRDHLGITQAQAARLFNVQLRTWQRWEAGTFSPDAYNSSMMGIILGKPKVENAAAIIEGNKPFMAQGIIVGP